LLPNLIRGSNETWFDNSSLLPFLISLYLLLQYSSNMLGLLSSSSQSDLWIRLQGWVCRPSALQHAR
jgi:hypothetical protein